MFKVDAYPRDTFTGTVSQVRLQPVVSQNVVSYVTIIDVPNRELKLKPGMTATVTIEVARADNAMRVPNAALRFRPTEDMLPQVARNNAAAGNGSGPQAGVGAQGGQQWSGNGSQPRGPRPQAARPGARDESIARVWMFQDGQLRSVRVKTGISDGTTTAIVDGELAEDAHVITGVSTPAASAQTTTSPFMPFGGRRPGQGPGNNGGRQGGTARPQGAAR
jgi:HlyD family secretion protein